MKTATNMDQRRNTVSCVSLLSLLVVIIKKKTELLQMEARL